MRNDIINKLNNNIKAILLNFDDDYKKNNNYISELKRDKIYNPIITVGTSTCGIVAGANNVLKEVRNYVNFKNIKAEIIETGCLGLCSAEPIVGVQIPGKARILFQKVNPDIVSYILDAIFSNDIINEYVLCQIYNSLHQPWENVPYLEDLPFFALQYRLVLDGCGIIDPSNIYEYIARGGYKSFVKVIRNYTNKKVCDVIEESELKGRGGGGFNTGLKWKIALSTAANKRYIICNVDESDLGAYLDRGLIESNPHKVIEGIAIAAYAIGANKAYIYLRNQHEIAYKRINLALEQAKSIGLIGYDIFDSGFNLNITVIQGPGTFVCGEETALIASLEGKKGMPSPKPPYPAVKGLAGMPTIVNNVETLVNIPMIIDKGPSWFKSIGEGESKGTKLFSLTGKTKNIGVIEVPMGTTLKDIVFSIGEGIKDDKKFKAVLLGGPSGYFIHEKLLDIKIGFESMKKEGIGIGGGSFVVIDESNCVVDLTKFLIDFVKNESCGKCIPCREGTKIIDEIISSIIRKPVNNIKHETLERFKGIMQLESLASVMRDTALCGLGRNATNFLLSGLKWFKDEYEEHIFDRRCRANVCKNIRTFKIDITNCTGCHICVTKCPENAILGDKLKPHVIINDKCTGCGICFEVCKFSAVIIV